VSYQRLCRGDVLTEPPRELSGSGELPTTKPRDGHMRTGDALPSAEDTTIEPVEGSASSSSRRTRRARLSGKESVSRPLPYARPRKTRSLRDAELLTVYIPVMPDGYVAADLYGMRIGDAPLSVHAAYTARLARATHPSALVVLDAKDATALVEHLSNEPRHEQPRIARVQLRPSALTSLSPGKMRSLIRSLLEAEC
jgi:hypothetical protein